MPSLEALSPIHHPALAPYLEIDTDCPVQRANAKMAVFLSLQGFFPKPEPRVGA